MLSFDEEDDDFESDLDGFMSCFDNEDLNRC